MAAHHDPFAALLAAATRLLEARQDQMVTADDWDNLRRAARACPTGRSKKRPATALRIAVVVQASTLQALAEHSVAARLGGARPLNSAESIVLLDAEVVERLLRIARPEDTRIDDVIARLAL